MTAPGPQRAGIPFPVVQFRSLLPPLSPLQPRSLPDPTAMPPHQVLLLSWSCVLFPQRSVLSGAPPFQEPCPALVPSPALPSLFPEFARFLREEGGVSAPHSLHLQGGDRVVCGFPSALLIAEGLSR